MSRHVDIHTVAENYLRQILQQETVVQNAADEIEVSTYYSLVRPTGEYYVGTKRNGSHVWGPRPSIERNHAARIPAHELSAIQQSISEPTLVVWA